MFRYITLIFFITFLFFSCNKEYSSDVLCSGEDCSVSLFSDNIFKIVQYSSEKWAYFADNEIKDLPFNHLGQTPLYVSTDGNIVVSKNMGYAGIKLFIFEKDSLKNTYILPSNVSVLDSSFSDKNLWFLFKSEEKDNNNYFISKTDLNFSFWENYFIGTSKNYSDAEVEYMAKLRSIAERSKDPEYLLKLDMMADEIPFRIQSLNNDILFSTTIPRGDRIQINLYSLDINQKRKNFISSYINAEKAPFSVYYEKSENSYVTYFSQGLHTYIQKNLGFPVEIDSLNGMDISFIYDGNVKAFYINQSENNVSVNIFDILKKDQQQKR